MWDANVTCACCAELLTYVANVRGNIADAGVINAVLSRDADITCADGGKSGFTDGCLRAAILKLPKPGGSRAACGLLACAKLTGKRLGLETRRRLVTLRTWGKLQPTRRKAHIYVARYPSIWEITARGCNRARACNVIP